MTLWLATHFLFAALFLSSSALTPEECRPLVEPQSLSNISMLLGKTFLVSAFVNHHIYKTFVGLTDSAWLNSSRAAGDSGQLVLLQGLSLNATCFTATMNLTIEGVTATIALPNHTSMFHILPGCDGCVTLSANTTTTGAAALGDLLKISRDVTAGITELKSRALYVYSSETTLKDADLERFKLQAGCLGFSGEPDFQYDPEKGFCREGEGVRMQ